MRLTKKWIAKFIYNSNGIENIYTPEKDILSILQGKTKGSSPMILNQIAAVEYVKKNKAVIPTLAMIMELHRILLKDVDRTAGQYRNASVYIGGREAPHWSSLHYRLDNWLFSWTQCENVAETSAKDALSRHYEYEYIHPFFDGNGRSGRLLLLWDCLYHKAKMEIIECATKNKYYDAIERHLEIR